MLLLLAVVGVLVSVAVATGLVGGSPAPAQSTSAAPSGAESRETTPTPAARRAVAPVAMPRSAPVRLRIPKIGVDSTLMDLGIMPGGALETPPGAFPAGWFTGGPTPGEIGPAIIVGHVRYETPGVFARLAELRRGDEVVVRRQDGSKATFRVTRLAHVDKASFPTKRVYGDIDHPGLRLITCGGLDAGTNEYDENVVVFADLVQS